MYGAQQIQLVVFVLLSRIQGRNTYRSMTIASLEGVEKSPDTHTMLLCRSRASRSYSCRVWSRLRFLL